MQSPPAFDGIVRLPHWGLIRVSGDDAASFLQGQLTQDVSALAIGESRLAGYCSPKGRLLASFVIWTNPEREIFLACSAELAARIVKRLRMYVLRAKCKVDDVGEQWSLWGVAGASVAAWPQAQPLVRLPDGEGQARAIGCVAAGAPPPALPALDPAAWDWLEVSSGVPRIAAATAEQFVPQMVNLDLVNGVSFSKGCYPGQEVVARSQYRGTVKRRMFRFSVAAPALPGAEVFDTADPGQPAGMVVNGASLGSAPSALVEVKLAALEGRLLRLGGPEGPVLEPLAMPYEVPAPA